MWNQVRPTEFGNKPEGLKNQKHFDGSDSHCSQHNPQHARNGPLPRTKVFPLSVEAPRRDKSAEQTEPKGQQKSDEENSGEAFNSTALPQPPSDQRPSGCQMKENHGRPRELAIPTQRELNLRPIDHRAAFRTYVTLGRGQVRIARETVQRFGVILFGEVCQLRVSGYAMIVSSRMHACLSAPQIHY